MTPHTSRGRWRRLWRVDAESGNAIIEFVFVAIIVLVPLIYLIAAVATVQRTQLAVTQAARDAGRAFATSDNPAEASVRVQAAVRLALHDQNLPADAQVRFVAAGARCDADAVTPRLTPGAQFTVCVTRRVDLPAIPSLLQGRGVTTTGAYTVHIDDFRALP
jgi:Flp pilus assembly protein TadG